MGAEHLWEQGVAPILGPNQLRAVENFQKSLHSTCKTPEEHHGTYITPVFGKPKVKLKA
jgi:hypothetical protein